MPLDNHDISSSEYNEVAISIDKLVSSTNICDLLTKKQIEDIGSAAVDGYTNDIGSRQEWEKRNARAMMLALQVMEEKTFPWAGSSNVKFPLITVAAMQYQAKAYPALIPGNGLVKCKVWGQDMDGKKSQIADRIATHMTFQNMEQDLGWEEDSDKLLLVQAIAGCAFRKRLFDPAKGRQVSKLVLPQNFVVNYFARDLESAPRYTETYYLTENDIRQRIIDGRFCEVDVQPDESAQTTSPLTVAKDERQGITRPPQDNVTPYFTGEQYCWLDLDDDEYAEPYIVTFDIASGKVHRIVARYLPSGIKKRGKDVYEITPTPIFTKYGFIPSPDGGFYDLGLGALLGPINESVNTGFNQSFDASTMATLGGGFLGRGFKSKAGAFTFQPNQWFPVDAPGDDLRKNIMPLPVREPPAILFQIIQFLVTYAERIVSATDLQMGENVGQNTPAETARTMDTNGSRVYNAIFKRTWRSLRAEFRIQCQLNLHFLEFDNDYEELSSGDDPMIRVEDYQARGLTIQPAADPHIVSDTQRVAQAQMLVQNAMSLPGHNRYQAINRLYRAMMIPDIEQVFPQPMTQGPDGKPVPAADFPPPGPDAKMLEVKVKEAAQKLDEQQFQFDAQMEQQNQKYEQMRLQMELLKTDAEISKLQADAALAAAQTTSAEADPAIKLIYAEIESAGAKRQHLIDLLDVVTKNMGAKKDGNADTKPAAVVRVEAEQPDQGISGSPYYPGNGIAGSMAQ